MRGFEHLKYPGAFFRLAYGALALSGLIRLFVHPAGGRWQDLADGASGFFLGVTLGAFLLGAWRRQRCFASSSAHRA